MKAQTLVAALVVVCVFLTACGTPSPAATVAPTQEPTAQGAAVEPTAGASTASGGTLSVDALRNATYGGIYDEPVTLALGLFEGDPFVEGDPSRPTVQYVDGAELYGDLDGDGAQDAVVFLLESTGGTGANTYVAAQLNRDGQPADAGAVSMAEEISVRSAVIEDGQVRLEIITGGPGDGDCCRSYKASKTLALQDGRLAEIGGAADNLQRISAADLNGTGWTLLALNSDKPALADVGVTVSFQDGHLSGTGGCNNYNGTFSLGEDNPFVMTVSPLAATKKACPDPIANQETTYFMALESVSQWGYEFGRLALYYGLDQGGLGRLLFAPGAVAAGTGADPGSASGFAPANINNDEGGPVVVTGEWNYTSYAVATHFLQTTVALVDASRVVQRNFSEFVPPTGQVLGTLTSPIAPPPATYRVGVPELPDGATLDVDNDGQADAGIQILALVIAPNIEGDSYLVQLEQLGYSSYLLDPQTGYIREGTFLVYAPDDAQGFPTTAGADGLFFTADDPVAGLPAGYTVVTLASDGTVSFDRSREGHIDTLESAAQASPNYSDQGILESYNSLIDLLKVRYSFTELRGLDWEQIRQEYLPKVEEAEATGDMAAYYIALYDLARSLRDSHVQVTANAPSLKVAPFKRDSELFGGSLGAQVVELSDGRFVVGYLDPEGPGAQAGWQFGTEIVSVDGVLIGDRVDSLPVVGSVSTPEGIRLSQTTFALRFPPGATTTVEYRLPGESQVRSATLTASEGFSSSPPQSGTNDSISFKALDGGYGYIQWKAFDDPNYKLAVFEKFLTQFASAGGIVIDLRDNVGGNLQLLYTMASYLFPERQSAPFHWIDSYSYDEKANDLVLELPQDFMISAPRPELAYGGAVVVLVNENTASAAEFFPQFLQSQGRAIVVGDHGTSGAGGPIERVTMPGSIIFQYTKGRFVYAGTDEPNLEAKGVTLDMRVPITLESVRAELDGEDPVLAAALAVLPEEAARRFTAQLTSTTWQWSGFLTTAGETGTEDPAKYTVDFAEDGALAITADCNQASGSYTRADDGTFTVTIGPTTLAVCPDGSRSEEFLQLLGGAFASAFQGGQLAIPAFYENGAGAMLFEPVE